MTLSTLLRKVPLTLRFFMGTLAVAVTGTMLVAGLTVLAFEKSRSLQTALGRDFVVLKTLSEVSARLSKNHIDVQRLLEDAGSAHDEEAVYSRGSAAIEAIDGAIAHLRTALAKHAKIEAHGGASSSDGRAEALVGLVGTYRSAIVKAVEMTSVDLRLARRELIDAAEAFNAIAAAFTATTGYFQEHADEKFHDLLSNMVRAVLIWGVPGGLIVFAAMFLGWMTAQALSRDLGRILTSMRRLGANEADVTIPHVKGDRDLEPIIDALKVFRAAMFELRRSHAVLEEKVKERTKSLESVVTELQREIMQRTEYEIQLGLYHKAFENIDEGIVITDKDSKIIDINSAFLRITGFDRTEAMQVRPFSFAASHHTTEFYDEFWASIGRTGSWSGEVWDVRRDGGIYPKLIAVSAVKRDGENVTNYVAVFRDITDLKEAETRLETLAFYDTLTELPNRMLFRDRLDQAIAAAARHGGMMAVMLIDLDRFKAVNDTMGHAAGDKLLKIVARRLKENVRASDTLARIGGDEFTVVVTNVSDKEAVVEVARKIVASFEPTIEIDNKFVDVGGSIGVSMYPDHGTEPEILLRHADIAMYDAKQTEGNCFRFYDPGMHQASSRRVSLVARLKRAIEKSEFQIAYQPIVDMRDSRIVGAEALVRWYEDGKTVIAPNEFIPFAEEVGLIMPIEQWLLRTVNGQTRNWHEHGMAPIQMSVNLSAAHVGYREALIDTIAETIGDLSPGISRLIVDLTETGLIHDPENARQVMTAVRRLGAGVAIDDFGAGYAGLGYLLNFPVDIVKIDRTLIDAIPSDEKKRIALRAIVALVRDLGIEVVAEGVSADTQRRFLLDHGCHIGQGYLFSPPLDPDAFLDFALSNGQARTHG